MEVYLDNSATTRCLDSVRDIMAKIMTEDYGNPSSLHLKGVKAENYIKEAKERICKILKAKDKEILFTSGGTESNNLAILGTALANQRTGRHLITTKIEHLSVLRPFAHLEELGFEVTYLPVNTFGLLDLQALKNAIRPDTILVSIMQVNNEIGTIQPIKEAVDIVRSNNGRTYVHVDSVQGFGKLPLIPKKIGVDLLSASAHKIHGPKGVGFLYVQEKVKIQPILFGGAQQRDLRSGTENVPGIAGLGQAVAEAYIDLDRKMEELYHLRSYFIEQIMMLEDVTFHGYLDERNAPHIISVNFNGVRSEVLLHALEDKGIYVSSGSACASNKRSKSETLAAIGKIGEQAEGTIRFSLSVESTREDLDYCIEQLQCLLPVLRKYKRY